MAFNIISFYNNKLKIKMKFQFDILLKIIRHVCYTLYFDGRMRGCLNLQNCGRGHGNSVVKLIDLLEALPGPTGE
jgi:hypothetical protein